MIQLASAQTLANISIVFTPLSNLRSKLMTCCMEQHMTRCMEQHTLKHWLTE